jgi:hypothetical protein
MGDHHGIIGESFCFCRPSRCCVFLWLLHGLSYRKKRAETAGRMWTLLFSVFSHGPSVASSPTITVLIQSRHFIDTHTRSATAFFSSVSTSFSCFVLFFCFPRKLWQEWFIHTILNWNTNFCVRNEWRIFFYFFFK